MKKTTISAIILAGLILVPFAAAENLHTLTLKILDNKEGKPIYAAIYDHSDSFLNIDLAKYKKVFIRNDEDIYVVKGIPRGNYALSVYQDINGNKKLDKSFWGAPKEPYGFSNNATGLVGPPSFKDCEFSVLDNTTIEITLK